MCRMAHRGPATAIATVAILATALGCSDWNSRNSPNSRSKGRGRSLRVTQRAYVTAGGGDAASPPDSSGLPPLPGPVLAPTGPPPPCIAPTGGYGGTATRAATHTSPSSNFSTAKFSRTPFHALFRTSKYHALVRRVGFVPSKPLRDSTSWKSWLGSHPL